MTRLRQRWGDCAHMTVERLIQTDPDFPKPMNIHPNGKRLWDEDEIEAYERSKVTKRSA